jgi:capsular exopolysaccharide synthesis family protein
LPNEILHDFYDLREYIRIASVRNQMRVLSITSSTSGEGSSTISTFLAFLMANGLEKKVEAGVKQAHQEADVRPQSVSRDRQQAEKIFQTEFSEFMQKDQARALIHGKKEEGILLVDANLNNPGLHRYFGLQVEGGLAEIVENKADWRYMAKSLRQGGLKVITAGKAKDKPGEIIGSEYFRELVKEWRKEFRYVVFDSPAVLQYVDALTLAAMSDAVILVVRAGQTRWEVAQNAKRKLTMAHANLLGVALNRHKLTIPDGYYKQLL